jgi:hypothetical protein
LFEQHMCALRSALIAEEERHTGNHRRRQASKNQYRAPDRPSQPPPSNPQGPVTDEPSVSMTDLWSPVMRQISEDGDESGWTLPAKKAVRTKNKRSAPRAPHPTTLPKASTPAVSRTIFEATISPSTPPSLSPPPTEKKDALPPTKEPPRFAIPPSDFVPSWQRQQEQEQAKPPPEVPVAVVYFPVYIPVWY